MAANIALFTPRGAQWGLQVPARYLCSLYISMGYTARSRARATRGRYTQRLFLLVRKHSSSMACSPLPIRYVYLPRPQGKVSSIWIGVLRQSSPFIGPLVVDHASDSTGNTRFCFSCLFFWRCSRSLGLTSSVGGLTHVRGHYHMGMLGIK